MSEHWTDRLSDYLDNELSSADRGALEAHLAGCAECAATLAELQAVVAEARSLPDLAPERDLWGGIEARLTPRGRRTDVIPFRSRDAGRRRVTVSIPQLVAAAIGLVLFSASGVWMALGGVADRAPVPGVALEPAGAVAVSLTSAYDAAIQDLESEFAGRRDELDPQTILVVERNLALIDAAIADARRALGADPSSGFLSSHLADAMRRKVDLLRRAATIQRTEI